MTLKSDVSGVSLRLCASLRQIIYIPFVLFFSWQTQFYDAKYKIAPNLKEKDKR